MITAWATTILAVMHMQFTTSFFSGYMGYCEPRCCCFFYYSVYLLLHDGKFLSIILFSSYTFFSLFGDHNKNDNLHGGFDT